MNLRTDVPVVYDGEEVYELEDGTLVAMVLREVESVRPDAFAFTADCWLVDTAGVPTGVRLPRTTLTISLAAVASATMAPGLTTVEEVLVAKRGSMAIEMGRLKFGLTQLDAANVRRLPAPEPAAPPDLHPLDPALDAQVAP